MTVLDFRRQLYKALGACNPMGKGVEVTLAGLFVQRVGDETVASRILADHGGVFQGRHSRERLAPDEIKGLRVLA